MFQKTYFYLYNDKQHFNYYDDNRNRLLRLRKSYEILS